METTTFYISGMACGGCASSIRQALMALEGVVGAEVSHIEATAEVTYDPRKVEVQQIKGAIEKTGYTVR